MARKTYTIHLAKEGVEEFEELLTESAIERLGHSSTQTAESELRGTGVKLIVFLGRLTTPKWMQDLKTEFELRDVLSNSACALMSFEESGRKFVATFAHGWMYLRESKFESDFGLKVSVNALDETRLKRLERDNLGDALRGVALSPFHRDFQSFGVDDALDLVRKVSGSTRDGASADVLTGSKSLKVSGEFSLADLPELAAEALKFFKSNAYKQTSFRIVDFLRPVTDSSLIDQLDDLATETIREGTASFELGLPSTGEDEGVGYKFRGPRLRRYYPDLLLRHYASALGDRLSDITAQTLKDHHIVAVFEDGARPIQSWTIRSGLVGSVVHEERRFAINGGEWYQIEEQFRTSIERTFRELVRDWDGDPPIPLKKIYDEQGNGRFQQESEYNSKLCSDRGYILLDSRLVRLPDAQVRAFEACDALDIAGKRFIHVKRNSRRSSVLSHFFKQGSNSGQQFKRFHGVWEILAGMVEEYGGVEAKAKFLSANTDSLRKWKVEFWIIDSPRMNGEFNIPFFSKISLRDEVNSLRAMNYEVAIRFIKIEPESV